MTARGQRELKGSVPGGSSGKLVMLCIRDRGVWQTQSLLFSYDQGG